MAVINVQNWSVEQVVDWITGLDSTLCIYAGEFGSNLICGEKLLTLMTGDLEYLIGIKQIGDQLLLHDAIQTLRDEVSTPWTTLQTLSLSLSVRCKNYRSELTQQKQKFQDKAKELEALNHHGHHGHGHHMHHHHHEGKSQGNHAPVGKSNKLRLETIPTTSLASASYLLDAGKVLIRWLTRFPFLGKLNYDEISRKLTKHCFELAMLSQRDTFADNAIEEVQYLCTKIIELCEVLIHSNDSLVIQPAGIDIITLRKRTEQDWGLQFESSYWGLHQITGVKLSSPAQQSGHLERGDEILQVNYQTVLAWPQTSVIGLLHENENEVIITVKRRPRHASTNLLLLGGHQNNMYLNKIPNRKSFFERKEKEKARDRERIVEKRVLQLMEEERTLADKRIVEEEYEEEKKLEHKADARFWKLYPKPKYLIKRRATVTGASPTDTRPPVTFINDETSPNGSSNDVPVPRVLHAVVHHRRSTPVTTLTEHDATPIMQLLNPPHVHRPPLDKSRSAPEEDTGNHQDIKPVVRQTKVVESDDDVFVSPNSLPLAYVQPPTPKPRLSRSSIPDTDAFKLDPSDLVVLERERKVTLEAMPDVLDHSVGPPPVPKRSADTCLSGTDKPIRRECPPEVVARRHVTPVEVVERKHAPPAEVVERKHVPPAEVVERKHAPPAEVVERKHVPPVEVVERKHVPPAEVVERKHAHPAEVVERKHVPPAEVVARRDVNPIEVSERKHAPPVEVVERKHVPQVDVASRQDVTPVERKHVNPIEVAPRKDVAVHNERKKEEPRLTPPQVPERPHKVLNRTNEPHQHQQSNEKAAVSILHRGILHIRSQLRKQSSSNSASALPAYGGSTSSIPSALMICSSSPRWIRQNAVFYSNNILEILNPVSRSCSVSSTTGIQGNNIKSNTFRVQITKSQKPNDNEFYLMQATEVHSRPFAFKISNADSVTYYLAAESQVELDAWLSVLSTGVVVGGACAKPLHDRTMLQRALGGLSSAGDSGRRNFARAPYKRSISLGSQSPNVSSTNLSCVNQTAPQSTPPPQPHNISPKYGSSSSLHVKQRCMNAETSPTRLLNRSKSSSLKTDWFLRNSSSNISSITITSKKITKSQVTQYPTPNSTPTKQPNMPMMGVAMKTKKNNGSSSSSPTRKYMCPNCCNVVKVDMSTQTDNGNNLKVVFFNEESRV